MYGIEQVESTDSLIAYTEVSSWTSGTVTVGTGGDVLVYAPGLARRLPGRVLVPDCPLGPIQIFHIVLYLMGDQGA